MHARDNRRDWTTGISGAIASALLITLSVIALTLSVTTQRISASAPRESLGPRAQSLIDLNAATAAQLESLPTIGPKRAAAIIADRQQRGPFTSLDDLDRVPGIGPRTIEKLADFLIVHPIENSPRR